MSTFSNSLRAWPSEAFARTLKSEIENLPSGTLPLAKAVCGHVDDSRITAIVLRVVDDERVIQAKVGIFFAEILAGCSCGDDPQPQNAYCEIQVQIDKSTGEGVFALMPG